MAAKRTACRASPGGIPCPATGAVARGGQWRATQLGPDPGHRQTPGRQAAGQPPDAFEVGDCGGDDVHPAVRVVHPVHRYLVDAQPGPLGEDQQFGVEEPAGVVYQWQQPAGHVAPDRLEAALRIREAGRQGAPQDQVVAAGNQLPLGSAHHPRTTRQAGTDGHVGVAGDERCHQRQQRGQVGGEVDVHVGQYRRGGTAPYGVQRPAAPLLAQVHGAYPGQLQCQPVGQHRGPVGTGVVGDGELERVRERAGQVGVYPTHAGLQVGFLVEDRDHQVESWRLGTVGARLESLHGTGCHALNRAVPGYGRYRGRLCVHCAPLRS